VKRLSTIKHNGHKGLKGKTLVPFVSFVLSEGERNA
jgi:hypothetical protein